MFAHAAPDSYYMTEIYLALLQQEVPQTHHPIYQYMMLMNQLSIFILPNMVFTIHI